MAEKRKLSDDEFDEDRELEGDEVGGGGGEAAGKKVKRLKGDGSEEEVEDDKEDEEGTFDLSSSEDTDDEDVNDEDMAAFEQLKRKQISEQLKSDLEAAELGENSNFDDRRLDQTTDGDGSLLLQHPCTSRQAEMLDQSSTSESKALAARRAAAEGSSKRKKLIEQQEEENKKMQVLMANFSEEQLNRYEVYRRSAFQKSTIKKIIQTVCGKAVSHQLVIAMSGIAKVFVGEIVEKALDARDQWNEQGALQPKHIRESYRLYKQNNRLASSNKYKKPSIF